MSSPVDWQLAERVAVRVAGTDPFAESYHYDSLAADFERLTTQAEGLVEAATGLRSQAGPARARVHVAQRHEGPLRPGAPRRLAHLVEPILERL